MDEIVSRNVSAMLNGIMSRGNEQKVFDWNKAAQIIAEQHPQEASAGLTEDWNWTAGTILTDGLPVQADDFYAYLASSWDTPAIDIDGEQVECYLMASQVPPEWGKDYAHIYWPESAIRIAFPDGSVTRPVALPAAPDNDND